LLIEFFFLCSAANGRAPAATVASIGKKEDKKDESELIDLDGE
jgi:hypothetical protein